MVLVGQEEVIPVVMGLQTVEEMEEEEEMAEGVGVGMNVFLFCVYDLQTTVSILTTAGIGCRNERECVRKGRNSLLARFLLVYVTCRRM